MIDGPSRKPSDHLADMLRDGYTVLEGVLLPAAVANLKREFARVRAERFSHESIHDGHFWMMDMLRETPDLARAVTHPVALWILRQYFGNIDIHYCHQPIVNT